MAVSSKAESSPSSGRIDGAFFMKSKRDRERLKSSLRDPRQAAGSIPAPSWSFAPVPKAWNDRVLSAAAIGPKCIFPNHGRLIGTKR